MGLDMYLLKYPRYKDFTPSQMAACVEYLNWERAVKEEGLEMSFADYIGERMWSELRDFTPDDLQFFRSIAVPYEYIDAFQCGEEVGYWRKANAVHKWFVDNVQEGVDDCGKYEVTHEQLVQLQDICKEIIEKSVLGVGEVVNGYQFTGSEMEPIIEEGKIILNPDIADELLPCQSGFFFGSTAYDEYYMSNVKQTYKVISDVLATTDFEKEMIVYSASW